MEILKITSTDRQQMLTELGQVLVHGIPESGQKPAPPALMSGQCQFYLEKATSLIDVFAAAHHYAVEAYNGALSKEDVRALVITVFIQLTPPPAAGRGR